MAEGRYPVARRTGVPSLFEPWEDLISRFAFPTLFERTLALGTVAPVDVCERDTDFVIRMACPGCHPDDIDVTVENDVVRVRGKFPSFEPTEGTAQPGAQEAKPETCLIRELPTGRFERDINLPMPVNAQQTHARFENGLLTLTLPKAQPIRGQKVQITTGTGAGMR